MINHNCILIWYSVQRYNKKTYIRHPLVKLKLTFFFTIQFIVNNFWHLFSLKKTKEGNNIKTYDWEKKASPIGRRFGLSPLLHDRKKHRYSYAWQEMILAFWSELENLLSKKKVISLYKGTSAEFIICYKWLTPPNTKHASSGVRARVVEFPPTNRTRME